MKVKIGILEKEKIRFEMSDFFYFEEDKKNISGRCEAQLFEGKILFNNKVYNQLNFRNIDGAFFEIYDVEIGINFHWQQRQNQRFVGDITIVSDEKKLIAINSIDIEKYICSVISSEMSANSFFELLKTHAVVSRSWLVANMQNRIAGGGNTQFCTKNSFVKWYERDSHLLFDVCADDHCQRYQGFGNNADKKAIEAVEQTKNELLTYDNRVVDARFSKCCGGHTEKFSSCWSDTNYNYLSVTKDSEDRQTIDLSNENNFREWVGSLPNCFCNTNDQSIISRVFRDYDKPTNNFFRWQVHYSNTELSNIIKKKSGIDFGEIIDLIPQKRGSSGRIFMLKIVGSNLELTVGKELEIRRWLSESHLNSSAFVVKKDINHNFALCGAGWGHGVGLCQIGASVMAAKGYNYKQILQHYYNGTQISRIT